MTTCEDVPCLALGDTRYVWEHRGSGCYVAWMEGGRGELAGGDGGHGWRVRGWERKCGGRRKGEPETLKSN